MPDLIKTGRYQQDEEEKKRKASSQPVQTIQKPSGQTIRIQEPARQASTQQTVQMPTATQQIMAQPVQQKWYRGEQPTASEMVARIMTVGQQNKQVGDQLWQSFQGFMNDPTSPLHNPYNKATSRAVQELGKIFKVDLSNGVNEQFIKENAWLMKYYRTGTSGTPLAPSKKSSPLENAAYWYYKVVNDEAGTQQAENEWNALREEISYWTRRADRNYTDDEILNKIDWKKYPTLANLDEAKKDGVPASLNRGIGYSQDNLRGVIWAARNGSTGDAFLDAVQYARGVGNQYTDNNMPDNPYIATTLDEAAQFFGVGGFEKDWLETHKDYLNGTEEERKYYLQVANAEETTQKVEKEWADLQDEVLYWAYRQDRPYTDAEILSMVEGKYKTLEKLEEDAKTEPTKLTRGTTYSRQGLLSYLQSIRDYQKTDKDYDPVTRDWFDATKESYNPYRAGSTKPLDEAAQYFNVFGFEENWCETHRDILNSGDATAIKYYQQVYDAEQFTKACEDETKEFLERIESRMAGRTAEQISDMMDRWIDRGEFSNLKKLQESLKSGKIIGTTRAIGFDLNEFKKQAADYCAKEDAARKDNTNIDNTLTTLGEEPVRPESDQLQIDAGNKKLDDAAPTVISKGTEADKDRLQFAPDVATDEYTAQVFSAIKTGGMTAQQGYDDSIAKAKQYANDYYFRAQTMMRPYKETQDLIRKTQGQLDELKRLPEITMDDSVRAQIQELENQLSDYTKQRQRIDEFFNYLENPPAATIGGYDVSAKLNGQGRWDLASSSKRGARSTEEIRNDLNDAVAQYDPTEEGAGSSVDFLNNTIWPLIQEYGRKYGLSEDEYGPIAEQFETDWNDMFYNGSEKTRDELISDLGTRLESKYSERIEADKEEVYDQLSQAINDYEPEEGKDQEFFINNIEPLIEQAAKMSGLGDYGIDGIVNTVYDKWLESMYDEEWEGSTSGILNIMDDAIDDARADLPEGQIYARETEDDLTDIANEWLESLPNFSEFFNDGMPLTIADIVGNRNELDRLMEQIPLQIEELKNKPGADNQQRLDAIQALEDQIAQLGEQLKSQEETYLKGQELDASVRKGFGNAVSIAEINGLAYTQDESVLDLMDYLYANGGKYEPTDYTNVYTLYDSALMQGIAPEAIMKSAQEGKEQYTEAIKTLDFAIEKAKEMGINLAFGMDENLQRRRDWYQKQIDAADWFMSTQAEDFNDVVKAERDRLTQEIAQRGLGPYVMEQQATSALREYGAAAGNMENFSEKETDTYLYLYATKGKEEAEKYYGYLVDVRNAEEYKKLAEFSDKFASALPITSNVLAIMAAPLEIIPSAATLISGLAGSPLKPTDPIFSVTTFRSGVRETSLENINKATQDSPVGNYLAKLGYQLATSIGDNAMNMLAFGGIGSGIENTLLRNIVTAAPMSFEAGSSAYQQAMFAGASPEQAMAMAGASIFSEWISETIEVGTIMDAFAKKGADAAVQSFKQMLWETAKDMFSEGVGEAASEIIESQLERVIRENLNGLEAEEWTEEKWKELGSNALYAGLLGSLSGGIFDVSGSVFTGNYKSGLMMRYLAQQMGTDPTTLANSINEKMNKMRQTSEQSSATAEDTTRRLTALQGIKTENSTAKQTAILSAVLTFGDSEAEADIAKAASLKLIKTYGADKTADLFNDMLTFAEKNHIDPSVVGSIAKHAALANSVTASAWRTAVQNGITPETMNMLQVADAADSSSVKIGNQVLSAAQQDRYSRKLLYDKVVKGALDDVHTAEQAVTDAQKAVTKAEDDLNDQKNLLQEKQDAAAAALQELQADPGNENTGRAAIAANEEVKAQKIAVSQREIALAKQQDALERAKKNLGYAEETYSQVRQEVMNEVGAEDQQRAEEARLAEEQAQAQAEQEAAEQAAQQENDNSAVMDADAFIAQLEEQFGPLTDEDRQKVYERIKTQYAERQNAEETAEMQNEPEQPNAQQPNRAERRRRDNFVNRISKKYNIDIAFEDTTRGGKVSRQNGYYDHRNNRIVLDENATIDDAIYFVAGHELTHVAERSETYDDLASSLLRLKYGKDMDYRRLIDDINRRNDRSRAAQDIMGKMYLYNNRLAQMHEQDASIDATPLTVEEAAQEVVADIMGEILRGNQDMVDRLVAEEPSTARRILNSIKSFLRKLTGMDGQWKNDIQGVVDKLETALKDAQGTQEQNDQIKYHIGQTTDGRQYVDVDTDQNIFDGLTPRQILSKAKSIIKERFKGQEFQFEDGNATVTKRTAEEYSYPATRRMPDDIREAKGRASTELDNLLKVSEQILPGDPDYPQTQYSEGHNKDVQKWSYYRTLFRIGNQQFKGIVNIARMQDFSRVYDITRISQDTSWTALHEDNLSGASADVSDNMITQAQPIVKPIAENNSGDPLAEELRGGTVTKDYSLSSWTPEEQTKVRQALIKNGFAEADVGKWISDTNSIASMIAADRTRLDFEADPEKTMLKPNDEYVKTLDASTLCAKRLLYQGTFDAIQHLLPNTALLPEDLIDLSNMMREMGYEVPCGICYVESRRRQLGKFTEQWLESYEGEYKPTISDVTTSDGLEKLRQEHPQAYQDFISAMNKKGVVNPKVVQLQTDYRGEIRKLRPSQIQKVKNIGGLRVQSFSDFEVPHLLDMMQAVMDMASKHLTAQAYTKVPNFAWAFGDTGIKINLSLIGAGTGLDANGNLIFDDVEGMPFEEAMKLRERYSQNVGTILVGINDAHILAAMADDRIDFIIPFHKSGWSAEELNRMPVLNSYTDYTSSQNEKKIIGKDKNGYKTESLDESKRVNFQPVGENGYWDFNKTGKENAETYLKMCAEDGRIPKFSQFLVDNGDGSFSLQPDGSTDGYWKTLIDFKMYDNNGGGSAQQEVTPNVNMEEAQRILNEYTLDRNGIHRESNNDLPVAEPVVERYVEEYKAKHPRTQYSLPEDTEYLGRVNRGEANEAGLEYDLSEANGGETHYGDRTKFSLRVTDPEELDFLNNQGTITTYKTMQLVDGKLYPPMAAVVAGNMEDYSVLGEWEKATEHPELIKAGNKFTLNKGRGKGSLDAAYNPYMHSSNLMINDQFSGAYNRPELVTVECQVPESEAAGEYHAEFAKDNVGWHSWHTGTVAGQLRQQTGQERQVFLSRWIKPVRIVPDAEVAQHYANLLNGTNIAVPDNVVSPSLLQALEKAGVPIKESGRVQRDRSYSLPSDDILDQMISSYLASGGMLSTNVKAPVPGQVRTNPNQKQRQFGSQTAQRSDALHEQVKQHLRENSGYDPDTNSAQVDRAISWVQRHASDGDENGYQGALDEILSPDFNFASADGQARMLTVMSMAALQNRASDEMKIAVAFNEQGTTLGQALQARQLFQMMTPVGRERSIRMLEDRLNRQYREQGKYDVTVHLSDETIQMARDAKSDQEFKQVQQRAYKELAEQMPSNWKDKLRAIRYFSMLFNPVTHIRNMIGNAGFMPAVGLKNAIGAGIERAKGLQERTKTIQRASKEARDFARKDAVTMKDTLTGESKYFESNPVERERKTFKGWFQKAIEFNSNLLEGEDWIFLRRHYANALSGWMTANNMTPAQLQKNGAALEKARAYAIEEAQKATYRDASKFASTLSRISKEGGVAGFIVDAALPFKKTPTNILKRGVEYSPLGLLKTIALDSHKLHTYNEWVKKGQEWRMPAKALTPNQYFDRIASGLSGTAISAVGALMAAMGWLKVDLGDDDEIAKQNGEQEYALHVSLFGQDVSYTIDWLAPSSMPLFVGASIYNEIMADHNNEDALDVAADLTDSFLKITEPVFNLSMLDGVNSLLQTSSWSDDAGNNITDIGATLASNYVTSFTPTVLGKVARTIDTTRRETYVESGTSKTKGMLQRTWQKTLAKIPGATNLLKPYVSPFGEEEQSSTVAAVIQNFLSPGYFKTVEISDMEHEMQRLYEATGDKTAIPKQPTKYFTAGGEKINLNAEQYTQLQKTRGAIAKNLLNQVVESPKYQIYGDDVKIKMVKDAWEYATQLAKSEIDPRVTVDSWIVKGQDNPLDALITQRENAARDEYIADHKSELLKALDEDDYASASANIEGLYKADKDDSYIRGEITRKYKPLYIDAYEKDDYDTMDDIEMKLDMLDIGYKSKTFSDWIKEYEKKKEDE